MEYYAPEFYIPEHIIGFTGDLHGTSIVYFKNGDTFGSIKQQKNTRAADIGRALVMTDSTHTIYSEIREGKLRHVEVIGDIEFLIADTIFRAVNDSNRTTLELAIKNNIVLRDSDRAHRNRALWDYAFGYTPNSMERDTLDYHIRNAARSYVERIGRNTTGNVVLEQASRLDWGWLAQDYKNYSTAAALRANSRNASRATNEHRGYRRDALEGEISYHNYINRGGNRDANAQG